MRGRHCAAIIAVLLLASACGARLTSEQRAAGIGALGGNANDQLVPNSQGSGGSFNPTVGGSLQSIPGVSGSLIPGGGINAPPPAGGNGGATDIGVTGSEITIASVADVSGVQPGLFKSAWQAVSALSAFVNSSGGIYGRQLKPLLLDSRADSVDNKAAVSQACDQAFAQVGSMSAFDDGGAQTGQDCGIPDISAITVNGSRTLATNVYPAYPVHPDYYASGKSVWVKQQHPDWIQHAGFLYLNAGASPGSAHQRMNALTSLGYKFIYVNALDVPTANYDSYVYDMKNKGVEYLGFVGDYESLIGLQKSMQKAGWYPNFRDWDSVAYSPNYLTSGGSAVEGSNVFLNTALFDEAASNPEMQLYEQWLARVAPGAQPDYFGMYAWSAGRLFVKAATAVGPHLTRAAMLNELRSIHSWNDYGMHAAHDIGNKRESPCFLYVTVTNGHFVREHPSTGWDCNEGGLIPAHA
ncbi:MAG: ABC transporter substrate-binding protein [Actinomycetota bacterium]